MAKFTIDSIEFLILWLRQQAEINVTSSDAADAYEHVAYVLEHSNLVSAKLVDISDEHNEAANQIESVLAQVNASIGYLKAIRDELDIRVDDMRRL